MTQGNLEATIHTCRELHNYLKSQESALIDSSDGLKVLGIGFFDLGSSYRDLSLKEPAEMAYNQAIEQLQQIIKSEEHKEFAITQIAASKNHLGLLYMDHGPVAQAIKYLDQAIWDRKYIVDHYPENIYNKVYLAGAYCNRGHIEREAGRPKSSIIYYNDSISLLEDIIPQDNSGAQDAYAAAYSSASGHPHWITTAHSFLNNARAGLDAARENT